VNNGACAQDFGHTSGSDARSDHQLQAAIAAQHAIAPSAADTDWPEILRLYDLLLGVYPSPAAALGRAVAAAEAHGPGAGLAALDALPERDQRWWAIKAELLARRGLFGEAAAAVLSSLEGPLPEPEREHRRRRVERWTTARRALDHGALTRERRGVSGPG
jgi:RNA polymerase sigma-70 factor (ECF subfamily)